MSAVDRFMKERYDAVRPRNPVMDAVEGRAAWDEWRGRALADLKLALGKMPERPSLEPEVEWVTRKDGYNLSRVHITSEEGLRTPMYVLVPDGAKLPGQAVIALHGHGIGVKDMVGLMPDGSDRVGDPGIYKDFGVALAKRGLTVIAPELLGFGELRYDSDMGSPRQSSCTRLSGALMMTGRTLIGARVNQAQAAIDYAVQAGLADPGRIGTMGISGGGMIGTYFAAVDPRVSAAVLSGYPCTYEGCIWSVYHCPCNYLPNVLEYGEMYDFLSLIAPRPMLWESASLDPIFPRPAVLEAYEAVKKVYAAQGAQENFGIDLFEGEHEISGAMAYDFLAKHL